MKEGGEVDKKKKKVLENQISEGKSRAPLWILLLIGQVRWRLGQVMITDHEGTRCPLTAQILKVHFYSKGHPNNVDLPL